VDPTYPEALYDEGIILLRGLNRPQDAAAAFHSYLAAAPFGAHRDEVLFPLAIEETVDVLGLRHLAAADFEIPLTLAPGTHNISVPKELAAVDELIVPTSYKAMSNDDPAFALFVFYLQAGLVEVLPQKWFTASQYRVGEQWIPRAARDLESQRIVGECFGVGTFLLEEDGCRLARWIERS